MDNFRAVHDFRWRNSVLARRVGMAGAPVLLPQPAAFAAAGQAQAQEGEAENRDEALMHNESLTQRARSGEGGFFFPRPVYGERVASIA